MFLSFFKCRPCHSTTDARIATPIVALTLSMRKNTVAKNLVNFGQGTLSWQPILWRERATSWHTPLLLFVSAFYNGWNIALSIVALTSTMILLRLLKIS